MQAKAAPEPIDARVRRRLRELRSERGLTLQQVADRASIDVSTLSRLEAGKRRLALDHIPALGARRLGPPPRHGAAGAMRAYKIHISEKRRIPPKTLRVHEGNDWLYVLSGRLRLLLGDQDL